MLYRWTILQTLPVKSFKWVENISQCSKDFIEDSQEEIDEICFLEVDVQYYNVQ